MNNTKCLSLEYPIAVPLFNQAANNIEIAILHRKRFVFCTEYAENKHSGMVGLRYREKIIAFHFKMKCAWVNSIFNSCA